MDIQVLGEGALPEGIIRYSSAYGGARIAVLAASSGSFEISVYDRAAEEVVRTITVEAAEITEFALSPDGTSLVYRSVPFAEPGPTQTPTASPEATATQEEESTPTAMPTNVPAPPAAQPDSEGGRLFRLPLSGNAAPEPVSDCPSGCTGLLWSPDNSGFAIGKEDGLYFVRWTASGPVEDRIAEPFIVATGGGSDGTDSYLPVSFSPSGRFLLARKGLQTGSVLSIIDRTAGWVENIPGTGEYASASTGVTWLFGDLLFIARPGIERLELLPAGEIWSIAPDVPDEHFVRQAVYDIPGDFNTFPDAPEQLPDGRVGFTLHNYRSPSDPSMNGLFLLDFGAGVVVKTNHLPIMRGESVNWLSDGSGALIDSSGRLLFVPAAYGQIYTLSTLVGTDGCCFRWLP